MGRRRILLFLGILLAGALMIAMVLFATSEESHARQLAMMKQDAMKRNAWFKGGNRSASAGIMLAPVGS